MTSEFRNHGVGVPHRRALLRFKNRGAPHCAPERSRSQDTGDGQHQEVLPRSCAATRAPDSLDSSISKNPMSNFTLNYSISKRTPASPKALKEILDVQAAVNRACTWTHERLSLAAPRQAGRATVLSLPFMRFGFVPAHDSPSSDGFGAPPRTPSADAFAEGSTRVRDNLWNAHLVVAFLKHVSRMHPAVLFELRDEGGFVIPGSVWIRGGKVEANRDYLNRERARALELTGDPQAAAPFVWAELQSLGGAFFMDAPVSDYTEVREVRELDASWDQLESLSLADIAEHVVESATKQAVSVMA